MKALLSSLFILLACSQLYALPNIGQRQYRWRNNDGDEAAATWHAPINTPITATPNDTLRLRIELNNVGSPLPGPGPITQTLEYSTNGTAWTVMNNPASNAFVYTTSSFVTNGTATTNQMGTATAGTFVAGKVVTAPGAAANLADGQRTEYEWVIRPTANAQPSTTYKFRSSNQQDPSILATLTMVCPGAPTPGSVEATSLSVACNTTTTVSLTGNTTGRGIRYQWQYNQDGTWINFGTDTSTETTPPIPRITQIRCAVICVNGSSSDTTAPITIAPLPLTVNLGNDINACRDEGGFVTLDAGAFPNNPVYLWDDNSSGQLRDVNQNGTYSVKVTDEFTCTGTDTIKVTIRQNPKVNLGNDTSVCNGAEVRLDAGPNGISYFWNTGEATRTIIVDDPGSYVANVTNSEGCTRADTIIVSMNGELPAIQGISVNNDGQYTFKFTPVNPQHVISYSWTFGDGSGPDTQQTPTHTYPAEGSYIVILKMQSICGSAIDSTSALIVGIDDVNVSMKELMIYPNPLRGTATLENHSALKMESVTVLNMVGQVVYSAEADSRDKHKLQLQGLPAGVYTVAITTDKGTVIRKIELLP